MKKNVLFKVLETLSVKEQKQFLAFLKLENEIDSDVCVLYRYILESDIDNQSVDDINTNLFPKLKRKDVLNKLSLLKVELSNFFAYKKMMDSRLSKDLFIHEALLEREMFDEAEKIFNRIIKELNKQNGIDIDTHLLLHKLLHDSYFSKSGKKYLVGSQFLKQSKGAIENYLSTIDLYYQIETLNREANNINDDTSKHINFDFESQNYKQHHKVLSNLLALKTKKSKVKFAFLYEHLKADNSTTNSETYTFVLLNMIQFCVREIKQGNLELIASLLEFYKLGLDKGSFLNKGFISARRFENIIDAACAQNDIEWAESALQKYINQVESINRNQVLKLTQSQIFLASENYESAINTLEELKMTSLDHALRYRWYKLACLYKLERFREFDSLVKSFLVFVKRNKKKLNAPTFEALGNYIDLVNKLRQNVPIKTLAKELKNTKNLIFRSWLKKQIITDPDLKKPGS